MNQSKAFTMSSAAAEKAVAKHMQFCQILNDENNLAEIRELAASMDIPTAGRSKMDLCIEIGATANFFTDNSANKYENYNLQYGGECGCTKIKNPMTGKMIQQGGALHKKLIHQGILN